MNDTTFHDMTTSAINNYNKRQRRQKIYVILGKVAAVVVPVAAVAFVVSKTNNDDQ